jgi:hypothetical protein
MRGVTGALSGSGLLLVFVFVFVFVEFGEVSLL